MYNVELFDKVNMFSLKKEELFKVLESLEENEEDVCCGFFDKYFSIEKVLEAFDLHKKNVIDNEYLKVWFICYASILNQMPEKKLYSIIENLKTCIIDTIYDFERFEEKGSEQVNNELTFLKFADKLLNLVSGDGIKVYCMIDFYDQSVARLNYLIVDEKGKKYTVWINPLMVNEEDIAEPILSKEDFENERKRLMALGFVEFN